MTNEAENNIIEIIDDNENVIKCELYDIIDFEDRQYALLLEIGTNEEEPELVIMRYVEENEEAFFETIDDDEEFEKVSNYIETLEEEEIEE
ncbi:DUF1292 domain-containing protein [bacterium]|nr:DUF1292 domain-containing protein [bacterium]